MNRKENWSIELSEYIKQGEPSRVEKAKVWETAIGLQDVDGLKPSQYLIETAKENIEGKIDLKEAEHKINQYYQILNDRVREEKESSEEADKVSVRIAEILSEKTFNFNPTELINIHRKLFSGIYNHAGVIRKYNFIKNEWILNGDTVIYSSYETIMPALEYDFNQEKNFSYKELSIEESIKHLCRFTSNIWQIHPFGEGNTRTTAVFMIKYLRTFGFEINDDTFAENSFYFRNSLVRANYKNIKKNIFEDISFLEKFFYNLLLDTHFDLKNRYTHIDYNQSAKTENIKFRNYTLEEQAIINIIKNNPIVKQEEIAAMIHKSLRTVKNRMTDMQDKGLITRKNGKRNGEWIIL